MGKEMKRLAEYKYDETFEPMIKNMDPRTIPEFVELTKGKDHTDSSISNDQRCDR